MYYIKNQFWQRRIAFVKKMLYTFAIILSMLSIASFVFRFGYSIDVEYLNIFKYIYLVSAWVFLSETLVQLYDEFRQINTRVKASNILFGVLYMLILIPSFVEDQSWFKVFQDVKFQMTIIGISSIIYVAKGIVGLLVKKTNPAMILSLSFLMFIFFGTLLLMLPRSVVEPIEFIDALFIATSAICVTGLTPLDISKVFTIEGQTIIMMLIQVGGLGVMTITSFFGLFFMGQISLYNKFVVKDILNSESISSLIKMLLYVFGFTMLFEITGATLMWFSVKGTLGLTPYEEFYFCMFHSISAFCNAGFSTLSGNLAVKELLPNNSFYLIISFLIVSGGLGFPILTNVTYTIFHHIKKSVLKFMKKKPQEIYHIASVNSKIVIIVTLCLILGGGVIFGLLEWNNSLEGFTVPQKITQSLFNVITPRTAGFNSVDMAMMSNSAIFLLMFLMWVGGGAQSTAGGVKVNVFGVAVCALMNTIKGRNRVEVMNREISSDSINRVVTTIMLSFVVLFIGIMLLMHFEPDIKPERVVFEAVSALTTTGLSLNLTAELKDVSKMIVILLMFVGRVGFMTFVMGFIKQSRTNRYKYPADNVIIN